MTDLPYRIEIWSAGDQRVEELIATASNAIVARAAFNAAAAQYPARLVRLRNRALVMAEHQGGIPTLKAPLK